MSGAIDEDTRRTIAGGRATLGELLGAAQKHLQKIFIVFVLSLVGTILLLQNYVWEILKNDLLNEDVKVVFTTPFDVILLQVKIGLIVGILVTLPVALFLSRDALRRRGWWPQAPVARWKLVTIALGIVSLFVLGIAYAYFLFFPIMFEFLVNSAVNSGFRPTYSIVKWVEFIALLSLSFGLAAQLPLAMSTLAYAEIVPYETFRDKWKHAVLVLYGGGAIFTPPDPITQLMWATPLVALYAISLKFTRLVVTIRRSSERLDIGSIVRQNLNVVGGSAVLVGGAVYVFLTAGGIPLLNDGMAQLPGDFWPTLSSLGEVLGVPNALAAGTVALVVALAVAGVLTYRYVARELDTIGGPAEASSGGPAELDVGELDEAGVKAAPMEVFAEMDEDEALSLASDAMEADNPDKAQAILDRYDEAETFAQPAEQAPPEGGPAPAADQGDAHPPGESRPASERPEHLQGEDVPYTEVDESESQRPPEAGPAPDEDAPEGAYPSKDAGPPTTEPADHDVRNPTADDDSDSGTLTQTTTGIVDAFTEEETTEEDIGGYYYDITFILESLTSRAFRIVGLFMVTMAAVFMALYSGGIKWIRDDFLDRLPAGMDPEQVQPVALHPVEHLIFEIKFAVLVGIVVTLPLIVYYAWPALKERGLVTGDRRVLSLWGGTLIFGVLAGSIIGYTQVAPAVISWLAQDALEANMTIAYRIKYFGWLIIYTTVGIGLLAEIPVTLFLFHYGGLISFTTVWGRWREVTVAIFALSAVLSPKGIFTMLVLAVPIALSFLAGLGALWVLTLGGRSTDPGEEPAD